MQLRELHEYVKQRGFTVYKEYIDEGISGSTTSRPELDALMDDAKKRRFDGVLVWRFDRFARSTKHLVDALTEFKRIGITFVSFNENIDTSSPLGEAIFTIIGAMAQLERDIIRERVRAGLRNAMAKGKRMGRVKVRDDDAIVKLRLEGMKIRDIAKTLGVSKGSVQRSLEEFNRLADKL